MEPYDLFYTLVLYKCYTEKKEPEDCIEELEEAHAFYNAVADIVDKIQKKIK